MSPIAPPPIAPIAPPDPYADFPSTITLQSNKYSPSTFGEDYRYVQTNASDGLEATSINGPDPNNYAGIEKYDVLRSGNIIRLKSRRNGKWIERYYDGNNYFLARNNTSGTPFTIEEFYKVSRPRDEYNHKRGGFNCGTDCRWALKLKWGSDWVRIEPNYPHRVEADDNQNTGLGNYNVFYVGSTP
jgi:hypothetical protein